MEKKYQKGPKTKQVKQNILIRYFELYDSLSVGSFFFVFFLYIFIPTIEILLANCLSNVMALFRTSLPPFKK